MFFWSRRRKIVTDSALFSPALLGMERRLRFVEGDGAVEGSIPGPGDLGDQGGGHVAVILTGEVGDPTGAQEEAVHTLGPVFLLDLDEGLEFAQVMGVAGAVAHPLDPSWHFFRSAEPDRASFLALNH